MLGSLAACTGSSAKPPVATKPTVPASPAPTSSPAPSTSDRPVLPPGGGGTGSGTGGGTGGGDATAPGGKPKPDRCHTANLRGTLHQFDYPGHAGSEQDAELGLTNTGSRPCTIYGFPGLQLVGADGREHRTSVLRDAKTPAQKVTLAPGATAWAFVAWRFLPAQADEQDTEPLCGGKVSQLKVIAPDESTQLTVADKIGTVCDHGQIFARPFQATKPSTLPPAGVDG
jgi:hypothetical protein